MRSTRSPKLTTKYLGDFQIESGMVFVSDPCYELDTECAKLVENVKNGKWIAEIETKKVWGERVSKLRCYHVSVKHGDRIEWETVSADIGVDSGQAGVFDYDHFKKDSDAEGLIRESKKEIICKDEPWYSMCCDRTLNESGAGVIPFGVVSSSGLGDGTYICEVAKEDDVVVAIQVNFLEEEEDNSLSPFDDEEDEGE